LENYSLTAFLAVGVKEEEVLPTLMAVGAFDPGGQVGPVQ
jgi:hypothetical protein